MYYCHHIYNRTYAKSLVIRPSQGFKISESFTLPQGKITLKTRNSGNNSFKVSLVENTIKKTLPSYTSGTKTTEEVFFINNHPMQTKLTIFCPSKDCQGIALIRHS